MRRDVVTVVERAASSSDEAYVFNSWLMGARACWPEMRSSDYFDLQHKRISRLLATGARVVVLHPAGAPDVITAWAAVDGGADVAHYIHVRGEYRRMGLATRLLAGRTVATHLTDQGRALKRRLGLRYMPHLLDELR